MPRGGSNSTETTNFFPSLVAKLLGFPTAVFFSSSSGGKETTSTLSSAGFISINSVKALAIAAVCAGVVPQQPPIIVTPAARKKRVYSAKYSGGVE